MRFGQCYIWYILSLQGKARARGLRRFVKDLFLCLLLKDDGKQITGWREKHYRQNV